MTLSKELLPHQELQPSWNQVASAGGMARDLMGSPSTHGHLEEVWCVVKVIGSSVRIRTECNQPKMEKGSSLGFVPGISREIADFPGKIPGNKKLTGIPGNFPGNSRDFLAFPVSRFPGNEKSGKLQTLMATQRVT